MKSLDHQARLSLPAGVVQTVMGTPSLVACASGLVVMTPATSAVTAMYQFAYEAAERSVKQQRRVREWYEPSMN